MIEQIERSRVSPERLEATRTVSLTGRVALVTGASSGIGRAISEALSREGAELCLIGRSQAGLGETVSAARQYSPVTSFQIDFAARESFQPLLDYLDEGGRLDFLIHSAGVMHAGLMEHACVEEFDAQYAVNVRAPYLLTQHLLPLLKRARGHIVFINSSAGVAARQADLGQYSATKHALKAVADSLREELNPRGVRVTSVYLGRTATPMQEARFRQEGRTYCADLLLQPEDVASFVVQMLKLSRSAEITDVSIRPACKAY